MRWQDIFSLVIMLVGGIIAIVFGIIVPQLTHTSDIISGTGIFIFIGLFLIIIGCTIYFSFDD